MIEADRDGVRRTLTGTLATLGVEPERIRPEARLREDLELDSAELVLVSLELTRAHGVRVGFQSGTDLSVEDVCELVVGQLPGPR